MYKLWTGHSGRYCTNDRQTVCFKCRKSDHETRACPLDQGNVKCEFQGTVKMGTSEVTVIPNVSDTITEPVNIRQTKDLDKTDAVNNQIKVTAGTSTQSESK